MNKVGVEFAIQRSQDEFCVKFKSKFDSLSLPFGNENIVLQKKDRHEHKAADEATSYGLSVGIHF